jgi:hypothetical protein
MLYKFLSEGDGSQSHQVTIAPHLVMRGNLDFFLQRQSEESVKEKASGNGAGSTSRSRLA